MVVIVGSGVGIDDVTILGSILMSQTARAVLPSFSILFGGGGG